MPAHLLAYNLGSAGPIPATLSPLVETNARPCAIPSVPRVATNGGSPSLTTNNPFINPNASPTPTAAANATPRLSPRTSADARTTPVRPRTAPIERSSPSVMITKVIGSASKRRVEDWIPIFKTFGSEAKPVANAANVIPRMTIRKATPGMRAKANLAMLHGHLENVLFRQFLSLEFADNLLIPQNVGPVAYRNKFRQLRTDNQHSGSTGHEFFHQPVDLGFCADIN